MAFPSFGVSRNGELLAYKEVVLSTEGLPEISGNLRIVNVSTGTIYSDILEDIRNPQIAWDKHSLGFFYFVHVRSPRKFFYILFTRTKINDEGL